MMKKKILYLILPFLTCGVACANNDAPVTLADLPKRAQQFIGQHFATTNLSFAKRENDLFSVEYEVLLTDGTRIEFKGNGDWIDVECKGGAIPSPIIPEPILNAVAERYPQEQVVKIEREEGRYEVLLTNRQELTFDKQYRIVDIDY